MFSTPVRKKRVVGVAVLAVILVLFFTFNRFPKLDVVGEDLDAVTAPRLSASRVSASSVIPASRS